MVNVLSLGYVSFNCKSNTGVCSFSSICENFQLNTQKLGVQAPQKVKFELAISMLKYEKLPSTNSTKSSAH